MHSLQVVAVMTMLEVPGLFSDSSNVAPYRMAAGACGHQIRVIMAAFSANHAALLSSARIDPRQLPALSS